VRPRRPTTSAFAAAASNTLVRGLIPSHRRREFAGRIVTAVSLAAGLASVSLLAGGTDASAANAKSQPTVIATSSGAFGTMLVVGSGKYAGYTLYYITSDQPGNFGCTTKKINGGGGGPGSCTGPSNDNNAEWPAITTTGTPVAGPGVT